ncbi:MAG: hypothetical protein PHZ19_04255 [Candidatus Thermoplasmatota archaeon]|nr:hypothetical protein [Candidatus Thermoplasmatota archaeon]
MYYDRDYFERTAKGVIVAYGTQKDEFSMNRAVGELERIISSSKMAVSPFTIVRIIYTILEDTTTFTWAKEEDARDRLKMLRKSFRAA